MNYFELSQLLNNYQNKVTLHPNYLFRGQSDSTWNLQPSFTRIANQRNLTRKEAIQLELECVNKFSISARNFIDLKNTITIQPDSKGNLDFLGWFHMMQHYSAPTRYLDWSMSPWVALYFACSNNNDTDAVLFVGDFSKVSEHFDNKYLGRKNVLLEDISNPNSEDVMVYMQAFNTNDRIEAQQGRFSMCTNPLADHKSIMFDIGALTEIIIPKNLKKEIMMELYRKNITSKTLFPGIDGLGKSTYEYCQMWDKNSRVDTRLYTQETETNLTNLNWTATIDGSDIKIK
jgi:hypothetical protein